MLARLGYNRVHDWDPDHVRALRMHLGLTQAQFAEAVAVSRSAVGMWECGEHRPSNLHAFLLDTTANECGFEYDEVDLTDPFSQLLQDDSWR